MGPNGSENVKTLHLLKVFKLFLNFPPNSHHKNTWRIFEIFSLRALTILFRKFQIHYSSLYRNRKPQLSEKRALVKQKE